MDRPKRFVRRVMFDMAIVALVAGIIGTLVMDLLYGVSVAIGCVWVATNFLLLAWMLSLVVTPKKAPQLYVFLVGCAKLPASYLLLWWLFQVKVFTASGLTIGICLLPAVLLVRGLVSIKNSGEDSTNLEEGK